MGPMAFMSTLFSVPAGACEWRKSSPMFSRTIQRVSSPKRVRSQFRCCRAAAQALTTGSFEGTESFSDEMFPPILYNSMSRAKEPLRTVEPGVVRLYSCGPTVYDYAHIGNFRAFLTYDVIKRWLMMRGYVVRHVMNLTDVDDKIIRRVAASGGSTTARELTNKYADAFFADLALLNVIPADIYPRATEHIEDMAEIVRGLRRSGRAYEARGSTYFSVASFPAYGKLAQLERRQDSGRVSVEAGATPTDRDEYQKDNARDFALWKAYKPEDGEVFWDLPGLGKGRPGWHIECTCMAIKYLGAELDIHAGGVDLVFPHHENEIAQAEAHTGRPFARFWVHNGFVNIDDQKMSKSLGNFRTLRDIARRPDDARAFRYLVVSSQYRSALAFTEHSLNSARSTVKRLDALRHHLETVVAVGKGSGIAADDLAKAMKSARHDFASAMNDDLNTPRAAAAMFSVVKAAEGALKADRMKGDDAAQVLACLDDFDTVFGIFYVPAMGSESEPSSDREALSRPQVSLDLEALLEERKAARNAKDWSRADDIRNQFAAAGYTVVDTPNGPQLKISD